jgi:glycerol-3-phosphate dehydrogenase (NAD(P)+)
MKITVLGAGAWGTALARILALRDHQVTLWDYFPETADTINRTHCNESYLPGIPLPANLRGEADASRAVIGTELVIVASVSKGFRNATKCLSAFPGVDWSQRWRRAF